MILFPLLTAIICTFPREGAKLQQTERCHIIGTAETSKRGERKGHLTLNDVEIPVYHTGSWIAMVRVHPGLNTLCFKQGTNTLVRTFTVMKPSLPSEATPPRPPRNVFADLGIASNTPPRMAPSPNADRASIRILVDPGHGGADAGAFSPAGLREADFNLAQAKAVAKSLRRAGFSVVLTREGDETRELFSRSRRACKELFDLFISIHHNASGVAGDPREVRHTIAYASNDLGLPLAAAIQQHIGRVLAPKVPNNGADTKSLAVCRNPIVPSCLLEIDFIDCPEGEEQSRDPVRQHKVAEAVTLGVLDWLHLQGKNAAK